MLREVSFDMYEILAMTNNHLHPNYRILTESINKDAEQKKMNSLLDKMTDYVQAFLNKFGASKGQSKRLSDFDVKEISKSKGDFSKIKDGSVEKNVKFIIGLLDLVEKIKGHNKIRIKNIIEKIKTIYEKLKSFKSQYEKAYDKKIEIVCKEYECFSLICIMASAYVVLHSTYAMHEFKKLNPVGGKDSARDSYFNPAEGSENKRQSNVGDMNWLMHFLQSVGFYGLLLYLIDIGTYMWNGSVATFTAPCACIYGILGYMNLVGWSEGSMIEKMLTKTCDELKKSSHEEYLREIVKVFDTIDKTKGLKESVDYLTEESWIPKVGNDVLGIITLLAALRKLCLTIGENAVRIVKLIWNTVTGICPLIQTIDLNKQLAEVSSIKTLEEEIEFIEMNIESLKRTSKLPADKQKKVIEYQKKEIENHKRKIAKIKAKYDIVDQETEKNTIIKINSPGISRSSSSKKDDDFVLD